MRSPIRVAVIGGGCASVAAAFELSRPEHRGRFQVTVYQMGWRLGGKGASGRGRFDRIEEHGLHLWMGFYENAFRLLRECYGELRRDPAHRMSDWRDAFFPSNLNFAADLSPRSGWLRWSVLFPPAQGLPGDPVNAAADWSVAAYFVRTALLLRTVLRSLSMAAADRDETDAGAASAATTTESQIAGLLRYGKLATLTALLEGLRLLGLAFNQFSLFPEGLLLRLHSAIRKAVEKQIDRLVTDHDEARRIWEIADLLLAALRGAVRFRLATHPRGFDAINDYDCREWLRLNGASRRALNSAFVRALYDLAFAYEDGDVRRPRIAAGQALRGAFRAFFTYRGAFFWKMRAGMGDVVFAPFYQVLKQRGVRFKFFHRLRAVQTSGRRVGVKPNVSGLEFDVQARIRGGKEYQPLVDVRGLPCWPAQPLYEQIVSGATAEVRQRDFEAPWEPSRHPRRTLRVGRDFDFVVLGVGVGAVADVCRNIVRDDERWRVMVDKVKTVPTQAFQLWFDADGTSLGLRGAISNLSGFAEPFDTWADMSHLAGEESWPRPPQSIVYFCSVLPDRHGEGGRAGAKRRAAEVKRNAIRFLNRDLGRLWPGAADDAGRFRWEMLCALPGSKAADGVRRFDHQYWRANVAPSERYTLALPGTLRYRLSPLDTGYDNMTVAGDWTDCGFNEGCVEAAVMSGRLAAHALSGSPPLEDIVGYDHP